ncbi:PAP2 superfamily-domain-containing protein [Scheffersomyces amazonensis]|uniref:PAP2 superfamily-domain-containing protein n=1 Tax=Scheffersomyces amazonensis TaxID=1078765 RepID=UPI00315CCFE9
MSSTYDPIPYDHTYVLYEPNDVIALIAVHMTLLPIYIMVFYTAWFLITREIEPVIVVGGHLIGEILNKIVKRIMKQPRPDFHKDFASGSYSLTYGMPSAHSQFMGFFTTYFICIILFKIKPLTSIQKRFASLILLITCILVPFSRVYLLYHTIPQVIVGVTLGSTLGLLYFTATSIARDIGLVDWVLNWPIIKFFYIKDTYYHCYQTFEDEYNSYIKLSKLVKTKRD